MKLLIENGLLYIDNRCFCYAKVQDDGSEDVRPATRKVSTQYNHHSQPAGRALPFVDGLGWIGDEPSCAIRIGSVLGNDGPLPRSMVVNVLVTRIEACEEFSTPVTIEIK
jgi:hypothetical protein